MELSRLRSTLGTLGGLCHHDILVVVLPYIAEVRVLAGGYLLAGFLCLWCRMLEVADESHGLVE
jgi:hypothetical protein